MKTLKITLLLVTLLATTQVNAQSSVQPIDATINYDDAQRPCIQVNIDPEPKTVKKAWKAYLKENYDFKLKGIGFFSNKDLLSTEEVVVPQLSSNLMDFYTSVLEDENGSEMKVFVRYGYDIYLNKQDNPVEYKVLYEMLEGFLKQYLPKYYQERVDDTEKRVQKLADETSDLKEEIADDSASIEELKKEIEGLESNLESNNKLLKEASNKLTKRKEKLERIRIQLKNIEQ